SAICSARLDSRRVAAVPKRRGQGRQLLRQTGGPATDVSLVLLPPRAKALPPRRRGDVLVDPTAVVGGGGARVIPPQDVGRFAIEVVPVPVVGRIDEGERHPRVARGSQCLEQGQSLFGGLLPPALPQPFG